MQICAGSSVKSGEFYGSNVHSSAMCSQESLLEILTVDLQWQIVHLDRPLTCTGVTSNFMTENKSVTTLIPLKVA